MLPGARMAVFGVAFCCCAVVVAWNTASEPGDPLRWTSDTAGPESASPATAEHVVRTGAPEDDKAARGPATGELGSSGKGESGSAAEPAANAKGTEARSPRGEQYPALRAKLEKALRMHQVPRAVASTNTPWEVFHWALTHETQSEVLADNRTQRRYNAISWLCGNRPCRGIRLLYLERGRPAAQKGPHVQGHHGQFLAILAQCGVSKDYPLHIQGKKFTVADLLEQEQRSCQAGTELTFKLLAFSRYLPSTAQWQNEQGESWTIPRLIDEEIQQTLRNAACGGTHRLMALSWAVRRRTEDKLGVDGAFLRAAVFVRDHQRLAFRLQNWDGSFSTEWFRGPGNRDDLDRKIQTTGHILEWLSYSVPEITLTCEPMRRSVDFLATQLVERREHAWEIGPLSHAIHGLRLYHERVFSPISVPGSSRPLAEADGPRAKAADETLAATGDQRAQAAPDPEAHLADVKAGDGWRAVRELQQAPDVTKAELRTGSDEVGRRDEPMIGPVVLNPAHALH